MTFTKLSVLAGGLSIYLAFSLVKAQGPKFVPLVDKRFNYTDLVSLFILHEKNENGRLTVYCVWM